MQQKQEQCIKREILLNNFIDKIMDWRQKQNKESIINQLKGPKSQTVQSISFNDINLMQLFDLLIWTQKKQPQLLQNILQMDILCSCVQMVSVQQMSSQIKGFILLINNCKVNGEIITYLLVNGLVDEIIVRYLQSIGRSKSAKNIDLQEQLEYLGSLLKACNNHMNEKTYMYFLSRKRDYNQSNVVIKRDEKRLVIKKEQKKVYDPSDIFNAFDQLMQIPNQNQIEHLNEQDQVQKQCLLIKVCTRFYNCPQQLTKTTVMNILMTILRQPFSKQLIINPTTNTPYPYITEWSYNLCSQLRNELKNFNQQLMVLRKEEEEFFIQEINDKIILWEDLTQTEFKEIFKQNFMHLVVYSLIVGSLNTHSLPMFNIKFTFFILAKMMGVCANLDLLVQVGEMLFMKHKIRYCENWVSTAVLKGFDLEKILDDGYYLVDHNEELEHSSFSGVNQFFTNMLRSKDQHFLQISSNMLYQMLLHARKTENSTKLFNETLGFQQNGPTLTQVSSILIGQMRFDHSLKNLKGICQSLIHLNAPRNFSEQNSNQFIYFYSEFLSETLDLIDKGKKYWPYLIETFQYDMKILDFIKFIPKPPKDRDLLIHPSEQLPHQMQHQLKENFTIPSNQTKLSFYNQIPQTLSQTLRYRVVKTFLFLKFNQIMLENKQDCNILTKYVQKLKLWQQKQSKPGDKIPYPLKQKFHQCKVVQEKTEIPCVVIQDDVNLIVGFVEANHVKIIVNVKLKHVQPEIYTRKDKTYIRINITKFDFTTENIVHKSTLLLRGFATGIQYLAVKKENFKEKELSSIRKGLKKTVQNLPEISLL